MPSSRFLATPTWDGPQLCFVTFLFDISAGLSAAEGAKCSLHRFRGHSPKDNGFHAHSFKADWPSLVNEQSITAQSFSDASPETVDELHQSGHSGPQLTHQPLGDRY